MRTDAPKNPEKKYMRTDDRKKNQQQQTTTTSEVDDNFQYWFIFMH
jgi:hypothetical protein